MTTQAEPSNGTLLQLGDGSGPETFATVAEVLDIEGPEVEVETEDVTNHDSNKWQEFIGVLRKGGEVSFECNTRMDSATQDESTGIASLALDPAMPRRNWQIVLPDTGTTTIHFGAILKKWKPNAPKAGALTTECTLQVSGPVTIS